METTWKVTEADRDDAGRIRVSTDEPRSLADLLPKPETIKQDAQRQRLARSEAAGLAAVVLIAAFILIYARSTPDAPPASPRPAATAVPTLAPTVAPTIAPTVAPTAAPVPTVEPPPPEPAPVAVPVAAPVSAPQPTQCAEVGIPGKMASACGIDSLETLQQQAQANWTAQYGAQYARETPTTR